MCLKIKYFEINKIKYFEIIKLDDCYRVKLKIQVFFEINFIIPNFLIALRLIMTNISLFIIR